MEEPAGSALEVAIADAGQLLVELEKFRMPEAGAAADLRAAALALGGRARRMHRSGTLDDAAAARLLREAEALVVQAREQLRHLRNAPTFRAAVTAHRDGDCTTLARLLPILFTGLEHVPQPPVLFHVPTWLRRNRPRPAGDVATEVAHLRDQGLAATGDAHSPGSDPDLPAVMLLAQEPVADPILLRFAPGALPPAVFRLEDGGEHLVHVPQLRAPFTIVVPECLDAGELGDVVLDHVRYRGELLEALARAHLAVTDASRRHPWHRPPHPHQPAQPPSRASSNDTAARSSASRRSRSSMVPRACTTVE